MWIEGISGRCPWDRTLSTQRREVGDAVFCHGSGRIHREPLAEALLAQGNRVIGLDGFAAAAVPVRAGSGSWEA